VGRFYYRVTVASLLVIERKFDAFGIIAENNIPVVQGLPD
jgi:hypothetical protein